MDEASEHPHLRPILASLSREIRRPLDSLRAGLVRFLDDPDRPISEAERAQAQTMLLLCEDLGRLTQESLDGPGPHANPAPESPGRSPIPR